MKVAFGLSVTALLIIIAVLSVTNIGIGAANYHASTYGHKTEPVDPVGIMFGVVGVLCGAGLLGWAIAAVSTPRAVPNFAHNIAAYYNPAPVQNNQQVIPAQEQGFQRPPLFEKKIFTPAFNMS